ncbi:hypothetical protein Cni_G27129 [Canna indica]|uniref:Uncharacterized protein n=1 Tax=Canna indica TaxID=4628 RepID=A0AAQ3L121_9LILI|nr:hypothetical protein Cni_G27129 [Canna indica]
MSVSAVAGDARDWAHDAFLDPALVADFLLSLRRRSRLDPEAEGDERPSTSAPPPPVELLGWGKRIKRSPVMRLPRPRIISTMGGEEDNAAALTEKRKGKRRASPQSPLEGYSSASVSGDEERAERSPVLSVAAPEDRHAKVVVTNPRAPSASPIPASCPIRRPSSKKMVSLILSLPPSPLSTVGAPFSSLIVFGILFVVVFGEQTKLELQAMERTLLEEKAKLLKETEKWRRAAEQLRSDNVKLQAHLELARRPDNFDMVDKDVQLPAKRKPVAPSSLPGRKDFIAIPDLNDPISDC